MGFSVNVVSASPVAQYLAPVSVWDLESVTTQEMLNAIEQAGKEKREVRAWYANGCLIIEYSKIGGEVFDSKTDPFIFNGLDGFTKITSLEVYGLIERNGYEVKLDTEVIGKLIDNLRRRP